MKPERQPDIISGRVNADGTIASGSGFTVYKSNTGTYRLTFDPGFRVNAVLTQLLSQGNTHLAHTYSYSENGCGVVVFNTAGTVLDWGWVFIATSLP